MKLKLKKVPYVKLVHLRNKLNKEIAIRQEKKPEYECCECGWQHDDAKTIFEHLQFAHNYLEKVAGISVITVYK